MDNLDPRSIRKGSKIRLDDTTEGSDAFVGGTVGHVNEAGPVIIDHMGTFIVEGLGGVPRSGFVIYRLAEHTPPEPVDERIDAWERVARHPVFSSAYDGEGPLIDSVMAVLDGIVHQAAPAPEPEWKPGTAWAGSPHNACEDRFWVIDLDEGARTFMDEGGNAFGPGELRDLRPLVVIDPTSVDVTALRDAYANEAHVAADTDGILAVLTVLGIEPA